MRRGEGRGGLCVHDHPSSHPPQSPAQGSKTQRPKDPQTDRDARTHLPLLRPRPHVLHPVGIDGGVGGGAEVGGAEPQGPQLLSSLVLVEVVVGRGGWCEGGRGLMGWWVKGVE